MFSENVIGYQNLEFLKKTVDLGAVTTVENSLQESKQHNGIFVLIKIHQCEKKNKVNFIKCLHLIHMKKKTD